MQNLNALVRQGNLDGRDVTGAHGRQSGVTMVEMMVALLILGVLLGAVATALVNLTRASGVNENRVQATALLTSLHENLQAAPYNRVTLYADELDGLLPLEGDPDFNVDVSATVPTYDGDPIVTIPGPLNTGCPVSDPECGRLGFVPRAYDEVQIDGRDFELFQIVTERSIGEGEDANIRRFITIVRWELLGRSYQEVFESERAPSPSDRVNVAQPDVRLFLFSPRVVELDQDGFNRDPITIMVRFQPGITEAEVELPTVDVDGDSVSTILTGATGTADGAFGTTPSDARAWQWNISNVPPGSYRFDTCGVDDPTEECEQSDRVVNVSGIGPDFTAEYPGGFPITVVPASVAPNRSQPTVSALSPSITDVTVGILDGEPDRFCDDLTLTVDAAGDPDDVAEGLGDELAVNAFFAGDRIQSRSMDLEFPDAGISDTGDTRFILEFEEGDRSPWRLNAGQSYTDRFYFIAEAGQEGRSSVFEASAEITVSNPTGTC